MTQIFAGPIPVPPRLYVAGVDRERPSDAPTVRHVQALVALMTQLNQTPGPFYGRFRYLEV